MTSAGGLLQWPDGEGWLVLLGGGEYHAGDTTAVDRRVIGLADADLPLAFVPVASGSAEYGEGLVGHYAELGGPPGYVVPLYDRVAAQERSTLRRLAGAGIIYLGGGDTRKLVETLQGTVALQAIQAAFVAGAVVVGISAGAAALGSLAPLPGGQGELIPAWNWLDKAVIMPHLDDERADRLRSALLAHPGHYGAGIPNGTALALGPEGQVEQWGSGKVTISLPVNGS